MNNPMIIALVFGSTLVGACATGPAMSAALKHEAVRVSCEKSQTEIVEKAERECEDKTCVATTKAVLAASHVACEAGMATLQDEIDGDVRKAQKLISGTREHYRAKHAALSGRLDMLERDLSDD